VTIVITKQLLVGIAVGVSIGFVFGACVGYATGLREYRRKP